MWPLIGIGLMISGAGILWSHWRRLNNPDLGTIPMENIDHYTRTLNLWRDPADPESFD